MFHSANFGAKMLMCVGVIGKKISITGTGKSTHSYVEDTSVPSDETYESAFKKPITFCTFMLWFRN